MAYKKPQIVAKSAARQSFVAGCPSNRIVCNGCMSSNARNRDCNSGVPK